MQSRKRYFPRNAKASGSRLIKHAKVSARRRTDQQFHHGRNLRLEFDKLVRQTHTLLSDDDVSRLWKQASTKILEDPQAQLQQLIIEISS